MIRNSIIHLHRLQNANVTRWCCNRRSRTSTSNTKLLLNKLKFKCYSNSINNNSNSNSKISFEIGSPRRLLSLSSFSTLSRSSTCSSTNSAAGNFNGKRRFHNSTSTRISASISTKNYKYKVSKLIQDETQRTSRYIDEVIEDKDYCKSTRTHNQDMDMNISRRIIQQEIYDAANQIGSSIPEKGPTGEYIYYFVDDLDLGIRSYYRKKVNNSTSENFKQKLKLKELQEVRKDDDVEGKEEEQQQKVFDVNLHLEYLGPMSLSVDEQYVARVITYVSIGIGTPESKIVVTDINSGVEYTLRNPYSSSSSFSTIHNVEFGPTFYHRENNDNITDNDKYHSIFITTCNENGRPSAVHACRFQTFQPPSSSSPSSSPPFLPFSRIESIIEDFNGANFVDVQRTKGCDYVAISSTSKIDNEVHLVGGVQGVGLEVGECGRDLNVNANDGEDKKSIIPWRPILVKERRDGIQYYVDCGNKGDVVILAHKFLKQLNSNNNAITDNHDGRNDDNGGGNYADENNNNELGTEISVYEENVKNLPLRAPNNFGRPIHNHSEKLEFFVEDMDLFEDYLVLYERSSIDSNQRIRILDRSNSSISISDSHRNRHHCHDIVSLGDGRCIQNQMITPGGNMHFNAKGINFCTETPLTPPVAWRYHFETKTSSTSTKNWKEGHFESERVTVVANDGTPIPVSLYFDKAVNTSGVVLIGYGSYGQSVDLRYDPALVPLVKRGFAIAFCHGRGGGDLGKKWYQAGRLYNKENAINDYLECAKALKSGKVMDIVNGNSKDPLFLACKSFSAGGILVGAAVNDSLSSSSPSPIFNAVSLINPFLDVMGTMMKENNSNHFLTEHEYDEFGDPTSDERAHSAIRSYCPLLNIKDDYCYPPTIIFCSADDENVPMLSNSVEYVMKIRDAMSKGDTEGMTNEILLHVEKEGGHHLHGRRLDVCTIEACFLLGQLYKSPKK